MKFNFNVGDIIQYELNPCNDWDKKRLKVKYFTEYGMYVEIIDEISQTYKHYIPGRGYFINYEPEYFFKKLVKLKIMNKPGYLNE